MIDRRHPFARVLRPAALRALCTAVAGAALITGCVAIPGTGGDSRSSVTVMTWAPVGTNATNMPGMPGMARAYAKWVNASGGIDGHELKVLTCNERNEPAGAAACARLAVKQKAVAVVGSYSQFGEQFMAPLEAASIPFIGGYGISDEEFSSYLSYPVNGGQAALLAGNGQQLAHGCERTALVRPDTLAGDSLPALLNAGLADGHRGRSSDIRAPEDATDYTQAARAARKAARDGGCVTTLLGDRTETFFDSYRRLPDDNRDIRVSSVIGSISQPLIDSTGGKEGPFEGAFVTGWYPLANDPAWKPMNNVISKFAFGDDSVDPANSGVQTTWIAYTALKQLIESISDNSITSGKLVEALDHGTTVDTGGLTPPLSWRNKNMLGASGFPRIVNPDVTFEVVRNGRLVAQTKGTTNVSKILIGAGAGE